MNISNILKEEKNIASLLDEDKLVEIGKDAVQGYDDDVLSSKEWRESIKSYLKLAMQIADKKTFPWPDAANVKYPLVSIAAMQFNARAYPTLVPSNGTLVSVATVGEPTDEKARRAHSVSKYMSYQILNQMYCWEEDMDKLLLILPIFGLCHKKTYFDSYLGTNVSELVHPFELVVDYWTKDLRTSPRITQILTKTPNEIKERVSAGYYLDVDLGLSRTTEKPLEELNVTKQMSPPAQNDDSTPYTILEQHTYLDLDNDGYCEPYVILVEYHTKKVLRISARFTQEDIRTDAEGAVISIAYPESYFTKYSFFPSPDGSYYSRGFGHMLGPLNEAVNTILNQLIDAGTLSNLQSGLIGKGIKIRNGDFRFKPGEWKVVNNVGSEISSNIFPLPVREPSSVLYQLLGMLVQSGKELASVAEIMTGKMPGQNTPAYTTQQTVEQGMKLFTAIYKRVYRSLSEEFRRLYDLNSVYLDEQDYKNVMDDPRCTKSDFEQNSKDIYPSADPSAASEADLQQKLGQIGNLLQLGTINPQTYTQMTLRVFGVSDSDIGKLMQGSPSQQPPQPSPEQQQMQAELQMKQQESQNKIQTKQAEIQLKAQKQEMDMALKQQEQLFGQKLEAQRAEFENALQAMKDVVEQHRSNTQHVQEIIQQQQQHDIMLQNQQQIHEQKLQQAKQLPKKEKPTK